MKKITFIFLFLCSISFGQNLGNPAIIGQTNRNQKVGKGLQVTDTLITDGVVILKNLATFGSGVDTGVGFKNGKIVRFLNTGGGDAQTLSISNDTLTISGGNSVILPVYIQIDSATITSYDVLNSQNAPPGSPATGDTYLVGTSPSGAWVGHAKDIAEWNGSAWVFTDGVQGDFLYNATNALTYIFRSGNWVQTTGIPALNNGNTISSGLRIGTNNARSLTFETNNVNRGRIDSIGRFYFYDTSLRNSNKFLQIDSATGRLIASAISANSGTSVLFPNGIEFVNESRDFLPTDEGKLLILETGVTISMPSEFPFLSNQILGVFPLDSNCYYQDKSGSTVQIFGINNQPNEVVVLLSEPDFNSLLPISSSVIEGKTMLKYLYDKSQNAIPLSGTVSGSPVTGDIEGTDGINIKTKNYASSNNYNSLTLFGDAVRLSFDDSVIQTSLTLSQTLIEVNCNNSGSRGLIGAQDFTANITDLDYTQKIYVGFRGTATLSSGTVTVTTDKIKTGYKIYLSVNTPSGTQGFLSAPTGSIVDETEFVINSTSATDDSIVNWWIAP